MTTGHGQDLRVACVGVDGVWVFERRPLGGDIGHIKILLDLNAGQNFVSLALQNETKKPLPGASGEGFYLVALRLLASQASSSDNSQRVQPAVKRIGFGKVGSDLTSRQGVWRSERHLLPPCSRLADAPAHVRYTAGRLTDRGVAEKNSPLAR